MKKIVLAGLLPIMSASALAHPTYYIDREIPYINQDAIANRIVQGCPQLGSSFSTYIVQRGRAYGLDIRKAQNNLSGYPNRIEVKIDSARSYGNAFIGHYKATHVDVSLYQDGVKVKEGKLARSSIGGIFGMFKSSCGVLNRVNSVLGKDIVRWVDRPGGEIAADDEHVITEQVTAIHNEENTVPGEIPLLPVNR